MSSNAPSDPNARNKRVAIVCASIFFGMVGAAYGAVPLYRAFCQLTGFDGTPRRTEQASSTVLGRTIVVRFDANVRDVPFAFKAEQTAQTVKIGETKLAFFKITNNSDKAVTARAVYNVVPEQAGPYFQKLQCFCFTDQTIPAKATVEVPVLYFIDPKYASDLNTRGKPEVTLSYTFFPSIPAAPRQAQAPAAGKKG
jgi:cytochrome c oxidase assembly protein subunit 11